MEIVRKKVCMLEKDYNSKGHIYSGIFGVNQSLPPDLNSGPNFGLPWKGASYSLMVNVVE